MTFSDEVFQQKENIFRTYEELHCLAEPSWQEKKTSHYIANFLRETCISVQTFDEHYGLIAEIPGRTNHVVAIRADLDALLQEVDGVERANHSCGHDAHSTMVLYVARILSASKTPPLHTIRFIFQPAEETAQGALQMIKEGALDHVHFLLGVHLRPWTEVPNRKAAPVILHSSALTIDGKIQGGQAHAARPQEGKNPIESASLLLQLLRGIRLRTSNNFSVEMTQFKAGGTSSNVIPETASFTLDLRAPTNEIMDELKNQVACLMKKVAELKETPINWSTNNFAPAAQPNHQAIDIVKNAIVKVAGEDALADPCISMGAEDFHFYTWQFPNIQATMLGLGCDLKPGLHHPKMTFCRDSLVFGTQILIQALWEAAHMPTQEEVIRK